MRLVTLALALLLPTNLAFAASVGSPKWLCDGFENAWTNLSRCTEVERKLPEVVARVEAFTRAKQQCLELIEFSVSEKRARIDQAQARKCIDAHVASVKKPTPSDADAVRKACADALVGLRKKGEACDSALECTKGLACIGPDGAAPGTCKAPLAKDAACGIDSGNGSILYAFIVASRSPCGPEAHCAANAAGAKCVAGAVNPVDTQPAKSSCAISAD